MRFVLTILIALTIATAPLMMPHSGAMAEGHAMSDTMGDVGKHGHLCLKHGMGLAGDMNESHGAMKGHCADCYLGYALLTSAAPTPLDTLKPLRPQAKVRGLWPETLLPPPKV